MTIAYIFLSPNIGLQRLIQSILPELESNTHSLDVVAMCFFNENAVVLSLDNEIGQRLARLSKEKNIVLMKAEKSAAFAGQTLPKPTECVVTTISDGGEVGCFPDFYAALGEDRPDRFISL